MINYIDPIKLEVTGGGGGGTVSSHPTIPAKLTHYYTCNESSGDLIDQVGSADGTITGSVYGGTGLNATQGDAFYFGGASKVIWTQSLLQNGSFSVNLWVNYDTGALRPFHCGNSDNNSHCSFYQLSNQFTSRTRITSYFDNVTGTVSSNTWYMLTVTFDDTANELKAYLNGTQFGGTDTVTAAPTFDARTALGARANTSGSDDQFWVGEIQHLLIADGVLTQSEIDDLYNSGSGIPYS